MEFLPYVFQIMAQLLRLRPAATGAGSLLPRAGLWCPHAALTHTTRAALQPPVPTCPMRTRLCSLPCCVRSCGLARVTPRRL